MRRINLNIEGRLNERHSILYLRHNIHILSIKEIKKKYSKDRQSYDLLQVQFVY